MIKHGIASLILAMSLLIGCAPKENIISVPEAPLIIIPSELLVCGDKSIVVPDTKNMTDKELGRFILKLKTMLEECQSDSRHIKKLIEVYNQSITEFNKKNKENK